MTTKIDYRLPLILVGGVLFEYLFWDEFLATNLLVFSIFIFGITMSDKAIVVQKKSIYIGLSHLLVAAYIVYNNSNLAIATWFISLLVYLGTVHFTTLKTISTAFWLGLLQVFSGLFGIIEKLRTTRLGKLNYEPFSKWMKYIAAPLILVTIFCSLYAIANPTFDSYLNNLTEAIRTFFKVIFDFLFVDISFAKCGVILLGCLTTAGAIISVKSKILENAELDLSNQLARKRRNLKEISFGHEMRSLLMSASAPKKLALKTENTVGVISFAALNALLALLNVIDISTLWLGNIEKSTNYSVALHDGTNTLIFSIVMAMTIIVYFFSGNLNFYRKNKTIKLLVFIWIAQNAFLIASVFLRDYYYIFNHGLTYKRIGVAIFATLCLVGLYTVWIKVAKQKTLFYLYSVNTMVWYCLLIIFSFLNWDSLIVNYNLSKADKINIDVNHLMSFSQKIYPILLANRNVILKKVEKEALEKFKNKSIATVKAQGEEDLNETALRTKRLNQAKTDFDSILQARIEEFVGFHKNQSWLSYSYLNAEAIQSLNESTKP